MPAVICQINIILHTKWCSFDIYTKYTNSDDQLLSDGYGAIRLMTCMSRESWLMTSSLHLANLSIRQDGITDCKKLKV
jgi:hypothetical protein